MAQDITIAGATFNSVPSIVVPTANSGSAIFVDPSPTTAVAADVASGKYFFDALGALTQGTASGGGGGGLVYESGTYTPTDDIETATIYYTNQHDKPPVFFVMADTYDASRISTNSIQAFYFVDCYQLLGNGYPYNTSNYRYANAIFVYTGTSTSYTSAGNAQIETTYDNSDSSSYTKYRYWASNSWIKPSGKTSSSTARYFRQNHMFKWFAVWKPTS